MIYCVNEPGWCIFLEEGKTKRLNDIGIQIDMKSIKYANLDSESKKTKIEFDASINDKGIAYQKTILMKNKKKSKY